jgi:hypothetical protein
LRVDSSVGYQCSFFFNPRTGQESSREPLDPEGSGECPDPLWTELGTHEPVKASDVSHASGGGLGERAPEPTFEGRGCIL